MKNKQTHTNFTESCAKKLIHLGELHCESKSFIWSCYEPKVPTSLLKKKNLK